MFAIKTHNLTKRFSDTIAVNNLNVEVHTGELFGLLGPNGAGKTTTIKMLSTISKPSAGTAEVAGFDIIKDKESIRRNIGIVFQDSSLDGKLTGYENLDFHARMYGMPRAEIKKRILEVLRMVDLQDKSDKLVETYSGGMKRRLEIARSLIHRPKILFLDEPTIGLDAQTRRHIWAYIKKLNQQEKFTVILTTHYMEEADYLCGRVAIVDHGSIVALDTPDNLKNSIGTDVVSLEIPENQTVSDEFIALIKSMKWVKNMKWRAGVLNLNVKNGDKKIPRLITMANKFNVYISAVNLHKPSLEDVFLRYTGRTIREEEGK